MKTFFYKLVTLLLFILSVGCFYAAVTVTYPIAFINIVLVLVSIFILIQACSRVDKAYGLGKYSATTVSESDETTDDTVPDEDISDDDTAPDEEDISDDDECDPEH